MKYVVILKNGCVTLGKYPYTSVGRMLADRDMCSMKSAFPTNTYTLSAMSFNSSGNFFVSLPSEVSNA